MTSPTLFLINTIIFLTTGSLILMWLGEQITQRGIGNGISLLITVGILADLPKALADAYSLIFLAPAEDNLVIVKASLMIGLFLLVVGGIIAVTQAQRKSLYNTLREWSAGKFLEDKAHSYLSRLITPA